jgi:toxin-antitoxin system PIN domain toxin
MISCDTNILLHAFNASSGLHDAAKNFLNDHAADTRFAICELVLIELYVLLRNPAVLAVPLSAEKAVQVCRRYRQNRHWSVLDYPGGIMEEVWRRAARETSDRRAILDARLALTLRYHGVSEFATANTKHFADSGFDRVWNPLVTG